MARLFNDSVILSMEQSGANMVLKCTTNAVGYALQSGTNLNSPLGWADVGSTPDIVGTRWFVTNTPAGGSRYFRLRKP